MYDKFKLTNSEKDLIKKVIRYLEKSQSELVDKISNILLTTAFENRFTLIASGGDVVKRPWKYYSQRSSHSRVRFL